MFKFNSVVSIGLLALISLSIIAAPATGGDIQSYRNAPIWYVEFEVSLKASYNDSTKEGVARTTTSISLDRTFSAMWPLDIRSDGPSPVLGASYLSATTDGSTPTVAEQIKKAEEMMARMETAANWMHIGGTGEGGMEPDMGPAKFEYFRVDVHENLVNELGTLYDRTMRTIRKGSGMVFPGGGVSITFEIDAAAKKYQLVLPYGFHAMSAMMKQEIITVTGSKGQTPTETKDSSELELALYPKGLTIDDQKNVQAGMPLIKGDIDLTKDRISGERVFAAHFTEDNEQTSVPAKLTFRYTLTMTPPTEPAAKGK